MIQYLLLLLLLIGTPSCSNSNMIPSVWLKNDKKTKIDIVECQSYIVYMRNCDELFNDKEILKDIFIDACRAAHFENTDIIVEDFANPLTIYMIKANSGFAALYIDAKLASCAIEFFCENESYNYVDFVEAFMMPIYHLEEDDLFYKALRDFEDYLMVN